MTRADDLVQVTEVALEVALARFREQGQKVAGLRREIEALDAQRDAAMAPTPSLAQAAQSELWRNWLHRKRRAHVSDLATALAEYERLRSLAQRTFGRAEAARGRVQHGGDRIGICHIAGDARDLVMGSGDLVERGRAAPGDGQSSSRSDAYR